MAVLVLALLLILAAPAGAASVSVGRTEICDVRAGCSSATKIGFTAAPGEANDLRIAGEGRSFTFEDPSAPVDAGSGCVADGAHRVVCHTGSSVAVLLADLGDRDDRARVPAPAIVMGGDGNDAIHGGKGIGGDGNDTLSGPGYHEGGPGDDRLVGGGDAGPGDDVVDVSAKPGHGARLGTGRDVYLGSPGTDWVEDAEGAAPSVDMIDGGGGEDTISYMGTAGPVVVDLGGPSSTDQLSGFEDARGTPAADTLLGRDGADDLRGEGGDDRIEGRGGNDSMTGGPGDDRIDAGTGADLVYGGAGRDVLFLGDGADEVHDDEDFYRDEVDCGAGEDRATLDRDDARAGCERPALRPPPRVLTRVAAAGRGRYRLHYAGWCDEWPSCRGTSRVAIRVGRRTLRLAPVRFAGVASGRPPRSRPFRLPAAAARALRARGRLTLRVKSSIDPGEAAGVLPAEDRVRLSRRARPTAPDR